MQACTHTHAHAQRQPVQRGGYFWTSFVFEVDCGQHADAAREREHVCGSMPGPIARSNLSLSPFLARKTVPRRKKCNSFLFLCPSFPPFPFLVRSWFSGLFGVSRNVSIFSYRRRTLSCYGRLMFLLNLFFQQKQNSKIKRIYLNVNQFKSNLIQLADFHIAYQPTSSTDYRESCC